MVTTQSYEKLSANKGKIIFIDVRTPKEYEEALKKWQKEKLESNGKYQKELEKHIK